MKKIPTLFRRGDDHKVRDEVVPGCEWVMAGGGVATRKYDGTACLIRNGRLYKRVQVKDGKAIPFHYIEEDYDEKAGNHFGWIIVGDGPEDRWHREAMQDDLPDGTYELCGPKVQGNPEGLAGHILIPHDPKYSRVTDPPDRNYKAIRDWMLEHEYEGLVYHHPDGRMVKIKKRDFPVGG